MEKEKKILTHEPVPGYRPAFFIIFSIAALYLAFILLKTL